MIVDITDVGGGEKLHPRADRSSRSTALAGYRRTVPECAGLHLMASEMVVAQLVRGTPSQKSWRRLHLMEWNRESVLGKGNGKGRGFAFAFWFHRSHLSGRVMRALSVVVRFLCRWAGLRAVRTRTTKGTNLARACLSPRKGSTITQEFKAIQELFFWPLRAEFLNRFEFLGP